MNKFINKHKKLTLIIINILIISAVFLLAEFIAGFGLEREYVQTRNQGIKRAIRLREMAPYSDMTIIPDEIALFSVENLIRKPYRYRYDNNGFLKPSAIHSNPDLKMFFLGGSTTECYNVEEDMRFPFVAGKLLARKSGLKVNSYNGGVRNSNSLHSINILINKVVPQQPNFVIMMHVCNEIATLTKYKSYWNPESKDFSPIIQLNDFSGLEHFWEGIKKISFPNSNLRKLIRQIKSKKKQQKAINDIQSDKIISGIGKDFINYDFYIQQFERNLLIFINICKASNIKPILMTQPNRLTENPETEILNYYKTLIHPKYTHNLNITYDQFRMLEYYFNETIRKIGKKEDVDVIDLEKLIPKEKDYIYDPFHLTKKGSLLAADIISDFLCKRIPNNCPNLNLN